MASHNPTGFFDLPLEIREMVYSLVFDISGPIRLHSAGGGSIYKIGGAIGYKYGLMGVCRRIHAETHAVVYRALGIDFFGDAVPHVRRNCELHVFKKTDRGSFATVVLRLVDIQNVKICSQWVQLYSAETLLEFIKRFPSLRNLTCVIAARSQTDEDWANVLELIDRVPPHINLDIERSYSFLGTAYPDKGVWLALKRRSPRSKFVKDLKRWEDPAVAELESRKSWPAPFFKDPAATRLETPIWAVRA